MIDSLKAFNWFRDPYFVWILFSITFIFENFFILSNELSEELSSKKIISKFKNIKPIYIKNYKLTDVEEFELLQEFKFLILSNSTFSWTSALLNNKKKKIIIPNSQTVFKENDDVVFFAETNCIKKLEKLLSKV